MARPLLLLLGDLAAGVPLGLRCRRSALSAAQPFSQSVDSRPTMPPAAKGNSCGRGDRLAGGRGELQGGRHGRIRTSAGRAAVTIEKGDTVQMDPGLPGMPDYLTVVFAVGDKPLGSPDGGPGKYKAVFTLHRPAFRLLPERQNSFERGLVGDSHLAITKPAYEPPGNRDATEIRAALTIPVAEGQEYRVRGLPNEKGFLGKLEVASFEADSFNDAHAKAYRVVALVLSDFSIQLDIPLRMFQVDLTELSTESCRASSINPFFETPCVVSPRISTTPEFRAYASLYRAGLNSNSLLYQFLCFYKITEGIRKKRVARSREAKRRGQPYQLPVEVVPQSEEAFAPWLDAIFPVHPKWDEFHLDAVFRKETLGRTFEDLVGGEAPMTKIRNAIGHAFTASSGKDITNLDEIDLHIEAQPGCPF